MDIPELHINPAVPLLSIDREDSTFRISTSTDAANLAASIKRFGLVHPPILVQKGNIFKIISGFARVTAAACLGWTAIPGRILPEDTPPGSCAQLSILDNCSHRALNLLEQARCLRLLAGIVEDDNRLVELANAMGFGVNRQMAEKLLSVNQMHDLLQQGLARQSISLPVALQIHATGDPETIEVLCTLLLELNLSLNRQRELFDWTEAIARREGRSIADVLREAPIDTLRKDPHVDFKQKGAGIRDYLKRRRYPNIVTTEERYHAHYKQVKLPQGIRLVPPPHFEGDTYSLRIDFKTMEDLKKAREHIEHLVQSKALDELLKIY